MNASMIEATHPGATTARDPRFPNAPAEWNIEMAQKHAAEEHIELTEDHWEAVRALQEYYAKHFEDPVINSRQLKDALDEKFHHKGGMRFLYQLFPNGPIAQGCRIAGLRAPFTAVDKGFGSVE